MRIGIDVRYLSHGLAGGVHTSIRQVVPDLLAQAAEHEIVLYADTKRPFELTNLPANVRLRLLPYHSPLSSFANDLLMQRAIARDSVELMHFPANYGFAPRGVATVITLHDAINLLPLAEIIRGHRKNLRTVAMMTYLHLCSTAAVRRADLLLTVSEHARREIARVGRYPSEQIVAIHHAPMPDLRRVEEESLQQTVRARYSLPARFVLADALKNPAVIIRAWQRLPAMLRDSVRIVFFCRNPEPPAAVREAVAQGRAIVLTRPPREDLIVLYSMAECFIFPSWIEGFGIPLLEAMACGAPIIASDRGAIPEVVGDAALIIDAEDDAALARQLTAVLSDGTTAQRLRRRGAARVAGYSWADAAAKILQSYERALRQKRSSPIASRAQSAQRS
jgi:glycosyltransferase involved in cell wall biosynthesis